MTARPCKMFGESPGDLMSITSPDEMTGMRIAGAVVHRNAGSDEAGNQAWCYDRRVG
jgi:hypothetical protein